MLEYRGADRRVRSARCARGKRSSAAASTRADFWRSRSKGIRRICRQQILELVENATSQKAKMEEFYHALRGLLYTGRRGGSGTGALPPILIGSGLIGGAAGFSGALLSKWVYRALEFLVVSCPCALVISVPLSFFGHRRCVQDRPSGQGQQLSGGGGIRGVCRYG